MTKSVAAGGLLLAAGTKDEEETLNNSLEIVNIALENNTAAPRKATLPKVASADNKAMMSRLDAINDVDGFAHSKYLDGHVDQHAQEPNIVIERDKLLEPSIDFQPEIPVEKSAVRKHVHHSKKVGKKK